MAGERDPLPKSADAVVIGAGFGGLAAALRLAELGARVVVCEALTYPGGCASTFERNGYRFEAGATLFSGFGERQLFRRWIERYRLDVVVDWLDPVVELRTRSSRLPIAAHRNELVRRFIELDRGREDSIRAFFDRQRRVADVLWHLLDEPDLLPPFGISGALRHASRIHRYLSLAPLVGRPLASVLERFRLSGFPQFDLYVRALCQITVQCTPAEAEALFALGTMDYYFRGTGHVRGGIGRLATGLVQAIEARDGTLAMANRVDAVARANGRWVVSTRAGAIETPVVVANVLPQNLWELSASEPGENDVVDELARDVERGWGACMLYRVVRRPHRAPPGPHHLQLVRDPASPLVEGNHVFCSFSGDRDGDRVPEGYRSLTASTHVPVTKLAHMSLAEQREYVEGVQDEMRRTLRDTAPEWERDVREELTASPRTFQRFTRRYIGYVGGIPRRVGLHNYRGLGPVRVMPGLYLVGDTVFPGQSTLATAVGGYKLAEHVAGRSA